MNGTSQSGLINIIRCEVAIMNENTYFITVKDNTTDKIISVFETLDKKFADLSYKWYVENYLLTEGKYNYTISLTEGDKILKAVVMDGKE